eukprot:1482527-Rhodomonas_salina.4
MGSRAHRQIAELTSAFGPELNKTSNASTKRTIFLAAPHGILNVSGSCIAHHAPRKVPNKRVRERAGEPGECEEGRN